MLRFVVHGDPLPGTRRATATSPTIEEEAGSADRLMMEEVPALEGPSEGDGAENAADPTSMEQARLANAETQAPEERHAVKESPASV